MSGHGNNTSCCSGGGGGGQQSQGRDGEEVMADLNPEIIITIVVNPQRKGR